MHFELRSEHAGRRVRFDYPANERNELHELFAVWFGATAEEMEVLRSLVERPALSARNFLGDDFETADVPQVA